MPDSTGSAQFATTPSWVRWWVVACIVCVFGPYVVSGVRTEQLAMYGSAGAILVTQAPRLWLFLRPAVPLLAVWACYVAVALVATLTAVNDTIWKSGSLVAGLDNALLPMATIVTVTFWGALARGHDLLRVACQALVAGMCLNTLVSIWTAYAGMDVPVLGRFWAAGSSDLTVAVLAGQNGRFSGVFNQPAEAGIAYSLAAFAVLYLVRISGTARWPHYLAWSLVIVGGLLTLSKVFVVGGIAVAAVMLFTDRRNRARMGAAGAVTVGAAVAGAGLGLTGAWGASTMLSWYRASVQAGDSPLYTISAGRFGSAGDVPAPVVTPGAPDPVEPTVPEGLARIAAEILHHDPVIGLGARGLQVSYDSTWGEAIVTGGLVGVGLMLIVHAIIVARTYRASRRLAAPERVLAVAVTVLVLGSSFGMPSLTGNRESTLLWIFVGLLVLAPSTAALRRSRSLDGQDTSAPDSPAHEDALRGGR
ncbi:hypothetical protein [Nocardioides sp. LHG3406-4]|uniref:hypothetical protein n=1 Tax=Nocardioides sp. LHG3406-4 TaxID=2804575 RepID=UPI003CF0BE68